MIGALFQIERAIETVPREKRQAIREEQSRPIVERFFTWCDELAAKVLDDTPLAKAIGYARNQRVALLRFLEDGRLPIHNNGSELQLRRQVVGRRNWLFCGSDDGAAVNTVFVSLLASCGLHKLEPWEYLRDLFCLLPSWPRSRVLELAPAYWKKTLEDADTQQRLAATPSAKRPSTTRSIPPSSSPSRLPRQRRGTSNGYGYPAYLEERRTTPPRSVPPAERRE
jgi:hypothetical protein